MQPCNLFLSLFFYCFFQLYFALRVSSNFIGKEQLKKTDFVLRNSSIVSHPFQLLSPPNFLTYLMEAIESSTDLIETVSAEVRSSTSRRLQRRAPFGQTPSVASRGLPSALRHSPDWAPGSSYGNHMVRRREIASSQPTHEQRLGNVGVSNKARMQNDRRYRWAKHDSPLDSISANIDVAGTPPETTVIENAASATEATKAITRWNALQASNDISTSSNNKLRGQYRDIYPVPPHENQPLTQQFKQKSPSVHDDDTHGDPVAVNNIKNTNSMKRKNSKPLVTVGRSRSEGQSQPEAFGKRARNDHKLGKRQEPSEHLQAAMAKNEEVSQQQRYDSRKQVASQQDSKKSEAQMHPQGSSLYYAKIGDQKLHDLDMTHHLDNEIVRKQFPISDSVAPEPGMPNLPGFTGQLISSSPSSSSPEFLKWPAPVEMEDFIPSPSMRDMAFLRYRAPSDRFFQSKSHDLIYDNWWVSWSRAAASRTTGALVANEFGFLSGGLGLRDGVTDISTGWRDVVVTEYTNRANQEVSIGAAKGRYGIFVDRSQLSRATAVEILARYFSSSTLVDFVDRDYGQRISLRNFDISIRHDFDEFIEPDPMEFATEVLIAFRDIGIALSSDVGDSRYGLTVGWRGRQVSILHDFDETLTDVVVVREPMVESNQCSDNIMLSISLRSFPLVTATPWCLMMTMATAVSIHIVSELGPWLATVSRI